MAYICRKDCKCKDCPHFRYDDDYGDKACFAEQDEKENKDEKDYSARN